MRNWDRTKALERLYGDLAKIEQDPRYNQIQSYGQMPVTVNLFTQDLPHILDTLAKAIAEERS